MECLPEIDADILFDSDDEKRRDQRRYILILAAFFDFLEDGVIISFSENAERNARLQKFHKIGRHAIATSTGF